MKGFFFNWIENTGETLPQSFLYNYSVGVVTDE